MSDKKWYFVGEEGERVAKQEAAAAQARNSGPKGAWRFALKNVETAKGMFVDTPAFYVFEHNLYGITGRSENVTCIKTFEDCPLCSIPKMNPSLGLAATIIDGRSYESKKEPGKVFKNQKRLIVFKGKAQEIILRRIKEQGGNLAGCVFSFTRGSTKTECATGEDIIFLKRLDSSQMLKLVPEGVAPKEHLKPFDYMEVFKPLSASQLRGIAGLPDPIGAAGEADDFDFPAGGESTGDSDSDSILGELTDDIPF